MSKAIKKMQQVMERKRMNQGQLAVHIGLSQGYTSSIMSGDVIPSDKIKKLIEEKLNIKIIDWYR